MEKEIKFLQVKDIPSGLYKHFNTDIATAKVLTFIVNMIKQGIDWDVRKKAEREAARALINKKSQWLDEFWAKHENEFIEQGFSWNRQIFHPLFNAYNTLSIEWSNLKTEERDSDETGLLNTYELEGHPTTGPLTYNDICSGTGYSLKDVKESINKLESLSIISRKIKGLERAYRYWMLDQSYLE